MRESSGSGIRTVTIWRSASQPEMASISFAAPQLLVGDLDRSLEFYERQLGFTRDFVYEGFYASVSRDRAVIHLKCAPRLAAFAAKSTSNRAPSNWPLFASRNL